MYKICIFIQRLYICTHKSNTKNGKNNTGKIVRVGWGCCGKDSQEWEANARLIAAAPELLETLKTVMADIEHAIDEGHINGLTETTNTIRAAINGFGLNDSGGFQSDILSI